MYTHSDMYMCVIRNTNIRGIGRIHCCWTIRIINREPACWYTSVTICRKER